MTEKKEWLSTEQACELYKDLGFGYITSFPIIQYAKKEKFGYKVMGRWRIDKQKFIDFLRKGDEDKGD